MQSILCIFLALYVVLSFQSDPFELIKMLTLIAGRLLIVFTALGLVPIPLSLMLVIFLLQLNIAEACLVDIFKGRYKNAFIATLLMISSFYITLEWRHGYYLVNQPLFITWIAAYTLWNWNFILWQFHRSIWIFHMVVLLSPIVISLILCSGDYWLFLRGVSLTLAGMTQLSYKTQLKKWLKPIKIFKNDSKEMKKPKIQTAIMALNATLVMLFMLPFIIE